MFWDPPTSGMKPGPWGRYKCLPHANAWSKRGIWLLESPLGHQRGQELGTVSEECTGCWGRASLRRQGLAGTQFAAVSMRSILEGSVCGRHRDRRDHVMFRDLEVIQGVPDTQHDAGVGGGGQQREG